MPAESSPPTLTVLAGPNGAGKSTYFAQFLSQTACRFVNADVIARALDPLNPMRVSAEAADAAEIERRALLDRRESFCFETVFSDPVGAKVEFLRQAQQAGYRVVLVFIGLSSANLSQARVITRVEQGGHDVPDDKIFARYPRTFENLLRARPFVDELRVLDNSSATAPYRLIARFEAGVLVEQHAPLPDWVHVLFRSTT